MTLKKCIICLAITGLITLSTSSLAYANNNQTNIVCTNAMLADFTSHLVNNTSNVTVDYIMPAGACPSHFDTRPSDVALITSADIIISLGWEPWLQSLLNSSGNNNVYHITCKQLGDWNIPDQVQDYVKKIRDELVTALSSYNDTISENARFYLEEISQTADYLQSLVNSSGYNGKKVICVEWQKDFVEWLGFNVTYSYGSPEDLSLQDELNVIDAASEKNVCAIIDNLQSGTAFGARVASETGISHVVLTNMPGAMPGTNTYVDRVINNTQNIIEGIYSFQQKQGTIATLENQVSTLALQRNISIVIAAICAVLSLVFLVLYRRK